MKSCILILACVCWFTLENSHAQDRPAQKPKPEKVSKADKKDKGKGQERSQEKGKGKGKDNKPDKPAHAKTPEHANSNASSNPSKPETVTTPPWPIDQSKIETTQSGLRYCIYEKGDGSLPSAGDKVTANYHGMLDNGEVFDSSFKRGKPFSFTVGQGQVIKGWDEGFQLLPVGTKAILFVPPTLGYGSRDMGVIPPHSELIFHVEVVDAASSFKGYKLDESKLKTTASGLQYQIVKEGKGPQAEAGKQVGVHYHGQLTDGKVFDSSFSRGQPITFPLGQGAVIAGWEEGIALLKQGSQAILIIPPALGYGEAGAPPVIPANATLRFDVELVEVQ